MDLSISKIIKGVISGFVATIVLSILMLIKKTIGILPGLDPVHMMSMMAAEKMGIEQNLMIGWLMHFIIGSVIWGGLFAVLNKVLPGRTQVVKGIVLGMGAWLLMMILPMPMSGAGLFGMKIGMMAPVMALVLHIVFGAVLGAVFAKLVGARKDS